MTYEEYCNRMTAANNIPCEEPFYFRYVDYVLAQVETEREKLRKQVAELEDDLSYLSHANAVLEKSAEKEPENEKAVVPSHTQGDTYRQLAGTLDNLFVTAGAIARELAHIREGK